jgi:tetratricopeptide (TPR) repeat protein
MGNNLLREGYYGLASERLRKAARYDPHEHRNQRELGKAYRKLATVSANPGAALEKIKEAQGCLLRASKLCPIDADTAYFLAVTETQLATLRQESGLGTDETPYAPLPYFETAIRLRPNGARNRYALAQYLSGMNMDAEMHRAAEELVRVYPSSYFHLKGEGLWSPAVKEASQRGLEQALEQGISVREAHLALSNILADDQDFTGAVFHYRQALQYQASQNSADDYIHLGRLLLKNRRPREAQGVFSRAINLGPFRERHLEKLYDLLKKDGHLNELCTFYQGIHQSTTFPSKTELLMARCLFDLKRNKQAQHTLKDLIERRPSAEAYYWLAKTHEVEKDWDKMERAIQKATVLDPENSEYHMVFSRFFKRLGKLERAEAEADLAIRYDQGRSPWSLNHRAWIKLARQDPAGAVADWLRAIELKPDKARFHAYAAEAYHRLGDVNMATTHFAKASKLDPDNVQYKKQLQLIESKVEARGNTTSRN